MKPFIVTMQKKADKKNSVRYDSPTPAKDYVTNAYIANEAFEGGKLPKSVTALFFEGEPTEAQLEAIKTALGVEVSDAPTAS